MYMLLYHLQVKYQIFTGLTLINWRFVAVYNVVRTKVWKRSEKSYTPGTRLWLTIGCLCTYVYAIGSVLS